MAESKIIVPHGGYRKLLVFPKSETILQGTIMFCRRFLPAHGDRTVDQMVQAARSCKQNIVEGSSASGTSKETEIKLTNVARASLDELLQDYEDYLTAHSLARWDSEDERAIAARKMGVDSPEWDFWKGIFASRNAETLCNVQITLIHQARKLLEGMVRSQEEDFKRFGGIRERMHTARTEARAQNWSAAIYSRLESATTKEELDARAEELRAEVARDAAAIKRRKGWR